MLFEAETTLANLHIISALNHDDKLVTSEERFDIDSPTTLRALMRFWYGEKRNVNVQRVRLCLKSAMDHITRTLDDANSILMSIERQNEPYSMHNPSEASLRFKAHNVAMKHFRMLQALKTASLGLTNLIHTYRDDPGLSSQISLLVKEVEDFTIIVEPHSSALSLSFASSSAPSRIDNKTLKE